MEGFTYHGHFVNLDPAGQGTRWEARVAVDVHSKGKTERIYYTDHFNTYPDRNKALEACKTFGKHIVDTFIVPTAGEGDLS